MGLAFIAVLAVATFCVLMVQQGHAADAAKPDEAYHRVPVLTHVFSADFCGPCKKLRNVLESQGVTLQVQHTRQQPAVDAFPSCVYVDNGKIVWDNGERIRSGQYRRPEQPVVIVEYITKGKQ